MKDDPQFEEALRDLRGQLAAARAQHEQFKTDADRAWQTAQKELQTATERAEMLKIPYVRFIQMTERAESAERVLRLNGFRRCDIAACNCGSWHAGPKP